MHFRGTISKEALPGKAAHIDAGDDQWPIGKIRNLIFIDCLERGIKVAFLSTVGNDFIG